MDSSVIVNQVIVLFLVIIVGFYASKTNIITGDMTKRLSTLLLQVTQPLLIVTSFNFEFSQEMLRNAGFIFVLSFAIHLFSIGVGSILYIKYPESLKKVLKFITVFSNCGFMGFPVLQSIFGSVGVFYGSIYVIPFNLLSFSYGIMVFTGKSDKDTLKKVLTHPIIISVFIGMILFLLQIKLPLPLYNAAALVGSMTTPLSMLIVGALLAGISFKEMFRGFAVYYGSAIRLVVLPVIVFYILKLLNVPQDVLRTCTILTAMPAAANTVILAEKYGGDAALASRFIGISTIASAITIPVILLLIG